MNAARHEKAAAVRAEAERWNSEELLRWSLADFRAGVDVAASRGAEE